MSFIRRFKKLFSCLPIFALLSLQMTPVQAAMVSNDNLLIQARHDISVNQMVTMLQRVEVQDKLIAMGVDPVAATVRVRQMNDVELAELTKNLEQLPAGSGVLGVLLTVFIVLIITDMLGATDIFPFVKNINK